jgi:hypothetical protein
MIIKTERTIKDGKFIVRFQLENFTDEEVYYLSKFGPLNVRVDDAKFRGDWIFGERQTSFEKFLLTDLPKYEFFFDRAEDAHRFVERSLQYISSDLDTFIRSVSEFLGESEYELRFGEEVKKINERARKAIDKNSPEYKEIINRNREAFEKLSKL